MALTEQQLKQLTIAKSTFVDDKDGQSTFGIYQNGYNFYKLVGDIVDTLNVGTATLVSNTLVDNLNGTYTWTPIVGSSFLINTKAASNPITAIAGLTATNVQAALGELYTLISGATGVMHPAVTLGGGSNLALNVDLVTQVATLDFNAAGSLNFITTFGGTSLQSFWQDLEARTNSNGDAIGVGGNSDMGTFTGAIITDNVSIAQALQELETAVTAGQSGTISTYTDNTDNTYTFDNNAVGILNSVLTLDLNANALLIDAPTAGIPTTTTTIQGAIDYLIECCGKMVSLTGAVATVGINGGYTTVKSGTFGTSNLIPDDTPIVDAIAILEDIIDAKKALTIEGTTNPALTINTAAPLTDKLNLNLTAIGSYSPGGNAYLTSDNIEGALNQANDEIGRITEGVLGIGTVNVDLGTFTGSTITDNNTVQGALQELETALESVSHSTSVMTDNTDGTYNHYDGVGVNVTIDTNAASSTVIAIPGKVSLTVQGVLSELAVVDSEIQTALGTATTDLGTFTGTILSSNINVKQALQQLETETDSISATLATSSITKYVDSFLIADWVANTISIPAGTHGKGINPIIQIMDSSDNVLIPGASIGLGATLLNNITISPTGDIVITSGSSDFDGRLIIL